MADECTNCGKLNGGAVCGDCDGNADRDALIASQSARIAELEAELSAAKSSVALYASDSWGELRQENERLLAERDAVRKALVLCSQGRITIGLERVRCDDKFADHDGTPEGVEAALLAAAREGAK